VKEQINIFDTPPLFSEHTTKLAHVRIHPDKLPHSAGAGLRMVHTSAFQILGCAKDILLMALRQHIQCWAWRVALILNRLLDNAFIGLTIFDHLIDFP
jgi:hypothetical protein